MYSFIVPKQLDNWFLTLKNKLNNVSFAMDNDINLDESEWIDKSKWKVYITTNIGDDKIFRTSPVIEFKEELNQVITVNGGIYLLKTPLNNSQLTNLKKIFY